jgi:NTE family protein
MQFRFTLDTRNVVALPTKGAFLNARYMESQSWLNGETDYRIWEGVFQQAYDFRGNSLRLILAGGNIIEGDPPLSRSLRLGGIRTFPGLRPGELRGRNYWLAGGGYSWRLAELQPVFGQAVYAGVRLQAAEVGERYDGVDDGVLWGISGSLNGLTPVGPFTLSVGYVDIDQWRLQFSLGRPMPEGSLLDAIH